MAQIDLPSIRDLRPDASLEEKYRALYDAYFMLTKKLTHLLSCLDSENVTELDANITNIKNLVAETIVTQTLITQTLYAEKGYIAELTVDQLDTSQKVKNYLANNRDDVNYIKVYEQNIEFRTGEVKTDEGGTPLEEHAVDRFGEKLYWVDDTHKAVTYTENDKPVMVYQYDETIKMSISFKQSDMAYEPIIVLGEGIGNATYPDRGKAFVHKDTEGLLLKYIRSDGEEVFLRLGENGNIQSHDVLTALDFYSNGFAATYGGVEVGYRWTKDIDGRITQLENIYTSEVVPVTWNGGAI